eukprot:CAMPEP_0119412414 /NCGR_PEP_ID=MMETSP1335-20130426/4869_1 /TAXON_ID=259385 /ORGANISM="Chrysoculter rhomboideus, Strain RCC1486" /LENGTH=230 /DNA_ID=CAMNT_0007437149 /DNA_START=219 /DNA_END=909 /DNA_ORIENTATION=-
MTPSDDNDDEVLDDLESETEQGWAETDPRSFVFADRNDKDDGAMGEGAREAAAPVGDTPGASCDVPTGAPGSVDPSVPSVKGIPVVERVARMWLWPWLQPWPMDAPSPLHPPAAAVAAAATVVVEAQRLASIPASALGLRAQSRALTRPAVTRAISRARACAVEPDHVEFHRRAAALVHLRHCPSPPCRRAGRARQSASVFECSMSLLRRVPGKACRQAFGSDLIYYFQN